MRYVYLGGQFLIVDGISVRKCGSTITVFFAYDTSNPINSTIFQHGSENEIVNYNKIFNDLNFFDHHVFYGLQFNSEDSVKDLNRILNDQNIGLWFQQLLKEMRNENRNSSEIDQNIARA